MAPRIEPTTEQLQAAFQRRWRAGWPVNLQAAMALPLYAALVRGEAVHHAIAQRNAQQAAQRAKPPLLLAHRPATVPAWPPRRATPPQFDRKRAAAGDRDDD